MELALAAECWHWVLHFRSLEKYTPRSFSVLISSSVSLEPVSADIMVSLEEVQKPFSTIVIYHFSRIPNYSDMSLKSSNYVNKNHDIKSK
ncbi:hypothetical protein BpHYR1_016699 [Brachionus plicatilis]|uniref:Uncharacterized protein n=1 Tax=Brachionus plicatilis TaxID=10195 RepID=A0A3M7RHA6_BRAPC|nr:hypothetical protein BpHYR1_016699 [Brachionus plicatilis]